MRNGSCADDDSIPHDHLFDAAALACAAGAACGVSPLDPKGEQLVKPKPSNSAWSIYRKRPETEHSWKAKQWQPKPSMP